MVVILLKDADGNLSKLVMASRINHNNEISLFIILTVYLIICDIILMEKKKLSLT
jgi:hypothetical protein